MAFVSENEGSDLGMPWPDGPPSSDCPVVWHADGPRRQIAQWAGTRTAHPGGTGVRDQYLPKTRECVSPFPQGLFMPPKTRPRALTKENTAFL